VSFLGWTFLLGAVAVVGPIVAHLLAKPRFRRVPFTMLQFLRTGRRESHSRRHLRDLLVLLLRCTIIVLLAIVFARPVLHVRTEPPKQRSFHYLALDDSMSMAYRDGGKSLFERMIEAAVEHVNRAPEGTSFSICGLASGRAVHGLTRTQARAEIRRLTPVPAGVRLADFLSILKQAGSTAAPGDAISAVVFSDFTPNVLRQFERMHRPTPVREWKHQLIAPAQPLNNVAIVDARAVDVSDNRLDIDVTVANYGDAREQELTLQAPDLRPVSVTVALEPHERRVVRLQMDLGLSLHRPEPACLPVEVTRTPKDNLAEDDTYRLAVYIPRAAAVNVLLADRAEETFLFETALQALAQQGPARGLNLRKVNESRLTAGDLEWADVTVFSSVPNELSCPAAAFKSLLARGGRLVFFATEPGSGRMAERLLREGLLPAAPEKWVQETAYLEPVQTGDSAPLRNYRLDTIALKGYWQCRVPPDTECLWRFANGAGFLYQMPSDGGGACLLVNTSIDDSLGLLAKSRAWVAFCRFLAGEAERVRQSCFCPEDRPVWNLPDALRTMQQTSLEIENCDGSRTRAARIGTRVLLPPPKGVGWMKTLGKPALYAAVNLPAGETDMSPPTEQTVADAMSAAFTATTGAEQTRPAERQTLASLPVRERPIWRAFAWAALVLLLVEPALTNRLKR
jgi:hypothetical protein